ncbi:MAG: RluA family pseudouridine synthase [Planctomycetota bacterium]|nr:MAG: RluA family pseudouridine synthase [Planctomycetota bacterium]
MGAQLANPVEILLDDDALLAVNKPAGILTVPGRQGGGTLPEAIAQHVGIEQPLRLVHRLDRETSGVLVLAKTLTAQRELTRQFQQRQVRKEYLAIVRGYTDADSGTVDAALAPHPRETNRMVVNEKKGRPAQTEWLIERRYNGIILLRCFPLTGRQHQIRVHLAHLGLPLLVDSLYAKSKAFFLSHIKPDYRPSAKHQERPLIARLTLHAAAISFTHPISCQQVRIEAPPPKDFRATLNQLGKLSKSPR